MLTSFLQNRDAVRMQFRDPPARAAWVHQDARRGFEVAFIQPAAGGLRIEGAATAVEEGEAWVVRYAIVLDAAGVTRSAHVTRRSVGGARSVLLEAAEPGRWRIDGEAAPHLDACLDVDVEMSALTNALPVRRLRLVVGQEASAPAAYVRTAHLGVLRLEQTYRRLDDEGAHERFDYRSPAFGFRCVLVHDEAGLVVDYPGVARRVA